MSDFKILSTSGDTVLSVVFCLVFNFLFFPFSITITNGSSITEKNRIRGEIQRVNN